MGAKGVNQMNKEEKLKQLRETIELAQKQIEELQTPRFDVCRNGYGVDLRGKAYGTFGFHGDAENRALIFNTAEVALKVDKILEPSRFIAQYVFEHVPDYVPDFEDGEVAKWYIVYANGAYRACFNSTNQALGVVYMPHNIAFDLCKLLNSDEYKLTSDNNE